MPRTTVGDAIGRIAIYASQLDLDISDLDLRDHRQMNAAHQRIIGVLDGVPDGVTRHEDEPHALPDREQVQDAIREEMGALDPGALLTGRAADRVLELFGPDAPGVPCSAFHPEYHLTCVWPRGHEDERHFDASAGYWDPDQGPHGPESPSAAPEPGTRLDLPPEPPVGTTVELRGSDAGVAERYRRGSVVVDDRWIRIDKTDPEPELAFSWGGLWARLLDGVVLGGHGDFTRHLVVVPEPEPVTVGTVLRGGPDLQRCQPGTWITTADGESGLVCKDDTKGNRVTLASDPLMVRWPLTVKGLPE